MATLPLTIAIPTYNRNATLKASLERLLPQMGPHCKLLIIDNHSDVPVAETLADTLKQYPALDYKILRNTVNIGANANILRCMEHCETDWAWMLGDDDAVKPDALEIVNRTLEAHSDCMYINFSWDTFRQQDYGTVGIREFVFKLDLSANLPWISSSLYKVSAMRENLRFGYQYTYSMIPHVVVLLTSVEKDSACFFSKEQLIDVSVIMTEPEARWSLVNLALGYPVIYDLPFEVDVREELAKKLFVTFLGDSIRFNSVFHLLMRTSMEENDPKNALYYYDQINLRAKYFERGWKRRLKVFFFRFFSNTQGSSRCFIARHPEVLRRPKAAAGAFPADVVFRRIVQRSPRDFRFVTKEPCQCSPSPSPPTIATRCC